MIKPGDVLVPKEGGGTEVTAVRWLEGREIKDLRRFGGPLIDLLVVADLGGPQRSEIMTESGQWRVR